MRAIWAEAEMLIFGKLRLGLHPKQLERELDKSLRMLHDAEDDYRTLLRSTCQRILDNLEGEDLFKELPTVAVYDKLVGVPGKKAKFEIMMYNRFEDGEVLKEKARDDEMESDMGEFLLLEMFEGSQTDADCLVDDEPLNASSLDIVEALHETIRKDVEKKYAGAYGYGFHT